MESRPLCINPVARRHVFESLPALYTKNASFRPLVSPKVFPLASSQDWRFLLAAMYDVVAVERLLVELQGRS